MLSDKSIKNIRATLRRILASAVEWELIDRIPNLPKAKVTDNGWDFFSREEVTVTFLPYAARSSGVTPCERALV